MENKRRPFPLIADGEPVIIPDRQMHLYENEDLITHIRGDYNEKVYQDSTLSTVKPTVTRRESFYTSTKLVPQARETSKAREEARRAIKKKQRQVFIDKDRPSTGLMDKTAIKPTVKSGPNDLSRFGKKLEQSEYILAELPPVYNHPQNQPVKEVKKNSYDFLKKSQIYNNQEYRTQKERRVAQELNLTRFED